MISPRFLLSIRVFVICSSLLTILGAALTMAATLVSPSTRYTGLLIGCEGVAALCAAVAILCNLYLIVYHPAKPKS